MLTTLNLKKIKMYLKIIVILITFLPLKILSYDKKLVSSVESNFRKESNVIRDKYRNPLETLSFFSIKKEMSVLEILPSKGWYTEILSLFLKDTGKLTVASFGENHPNQYLKKIHKEFVTYFFNNEEKFGKIDVISFKNNDIFLNTESNSQDMVLTFRNNHNWIKAGIIDDVYEAIWNVLKKDGLLGVVQHRSKNETNYKISHLNGYVPEAYLIKKIESKGFKLVSKSEINKNDLDTTDHPKGVWTLPPSLRMGEKDKLKYLNIGESDRMTLKFKKILR